jgi:alpha-glucosidase (family GH31 glycosyl hydrolase)
VHVDTGRRCYFDVGVTDPELVLVEVDLEPGLAVGDGLPVRFFAGAPLDVVRAFSENTSPRLQAPPDWVYRLWLSGNEWNSDERVRRELAHAEETGIPVGVVVIEAWSDEQTFVAFNGASYDEHADGAPHRLGDFRFAEPWPDPMALVDDLHRAGTKVMLWQIPLVGADEGQAGADKRVMTERGYCVRNNDGSPYLNPGGWFHDALLLDFTNPEASRWWLDKRRYLVEELGIDGFKTDGGEHAWGSELVYADGTRGGETNNRYPVLYQSAYHRLTSVTFSRAGFTGSAGFPAHWAGDEDSTWEAFRASITAGLTAAVSGVFFWGWDLAGFSGPLPSAELYLRAAAMAALCPIMQVHSEFNFHRLPSRDRTPWNVAEQSGDPRVVPSFRRFVQIRERLVPYLAAAGERASRDRVPPMRPLFLDYPRDAAAWQTPYEYLLGDALLVAPVCEEGADEWHVYLPPGEWVDVAGGGEVTGGQTIAVDAPLDSIPVFCAAQHAASLLPIFADPLVEVT